MRAAGAGLCLGSDSNVRLSWLEEMRWLEFVQRQNAGTLVPSWYGVFFATRIRILLDSRLPTGVT